MGCDGNCGSTEKDPIKMTKEKLHLIVSNRYSKDFFPLHKALSSWRLKLNLEMEFICNFEEMKNS